LRNERMAAVVVVKHDLGHIEDVRPDRGYGHKDDWNAAALGGDRSGGRHLDSTHIALRDKVASRSCRFEDRTQDRLARASDAILVQ